MTKQEREILKLRSSARLFNEKVFKDKGWKGQNEILDAISQYSNVAVRSGHSLSKSYSFARAGLWFLCSYPHSKVVMTAPTDRQVMDIFWTEIQKAYDIASDMIGGHLVTKKLTLKNDWYLVAFTTKDYTLGTFAGYHAPYVMLIFDEASGIPRNLWDAAEGIKTGLIVKHLVGGQPFDPNTAFGDCFKSEKWHKIHLSCYDSPNITGECDIPGLVNSDWVKDKEEVWGKDSPLFLARVLGEFPSASSDTLISLTQIQNAIAREFVPTPPYVIGLDVARFGDDSSVFTILDINGNLIDTEEITKQDLMMITGRAKQLMVEHNAVLIGVDVIGIGAGVFDRLIELGVRAVPVNVAEKAQEGLTPEPAEQFKNLRAQLHWLLYHSINNIHLIDKGRMVSDCSDIRYKITSQGQTQIEAKEDIKKRKKHSPDYSDSLCIGLYTLSCLKRSKIDKNMVKTSESAQESSREDREETKELISLLKSDWID